MSFFIGTILVEVASQPEYRIFMKFSDILDTAMTDYGVGVRKFEEILNENGIYDIDFRRISDYRRGTHSPSYDRAKILLENLEYDISEKELLNSLKENREDIKNQDIYLNSDAKEIRRTIRIKLKRLLPDKEPEEIERILLERIGLLFDDEKQISNYIQSLIAKDLQEYIVDKGDVKNDQNN